MSVRRITASAALALASAFLCTAAAAQPADQAGNGQSPGAVVDAAPADETVSRFANWIIASGDNNHAPFIVIDKVAAQVFVFDSHSRFVGAAPALLGISQGDDSAPGVGTRKLSAIAVKDRTTPAGRFVAKIGLEAGNHEVLWIDYPNAISLHPVITANKKERRLQRLNSPTADDNRITFGCINVSPAFYKEVVRPLFKQTSGIVYILPETKALSEVFLQLGGSGGADPLAQTAR